MLQWLAADLHLHTVLSACAEVEMVPPLIVERALELGLAGIAITDHNATENAAAVREAAAGSDLVVIGGMELQTREDVHLVALIDTPESVAGLQERVYASLPNLPNRPEFFGEQLEVTAEGEFVRVNPRLLQTATGLAIEEAVALVHEFAGLCLAAHVDRPGNGLLSILGFVPPELALDGVEVSRRCDAAAFAASRRDLRDLAVVSCSDAHRLSEMCARTLFLVERISVAEIGMALRREGGRATRVLAGDSAAT